MASTSARSVGLSSELKALLPVLIDEISRLKQLHSLAGIAELPVKDAVVREELSQLRADFAQIKLLFGGGGLTAAGSNQAPAAEAAAQKEAANAPAVFGQAESNDGSLPPTRPRMHSVNVSGPLRLPDGCDTHFFLVSTDDRAMQMKSS